MGYPPLVTPTSQMVGAQAVSNVLFGRYKMISGQVKDYVYGLYGRSPAPMDPEVAQAALRGYERGQEPISKRPADLIEPEMDRAREAIKDLSTDIEDILTYALYPTTGLRFLRIKHGLEPVPDEMKPKTLEQLEEERKAEVKAALPARRTPMAAPPKTAKARRFNVYVGEEFYQVDVDPIQPSRHTVTRQDEPPTRAAATLDPLAPAPGELVIVAPMPGILLSYVAEIGQRVHAGDPVVVLEAMKMENSLPSPSDGTVRSLPLTPGATVAKDDVLAIIAP